MSGRQRKRKELPDDFVSDLTKSAAQKAAELRAKRQRMEERQVEKAKRELERQQKEQERREREKVRQQKQAEVDARRQAREDKQKEKERVAAEAADLEQRRQAARDRDAFVEPVFDMATFDWSSLYNEQPHDRVRNAEAKEKRRREIRQRLRDEGKTAAQIKEHFARLDKSKAGRPAIEVDNAEANAFLKDLYYRQGFMFGRDRLFVKVQSTPNAPDISKRYIERWLQLQEINQTTRPYIKDHVVRRRKAGNLPPTLFIDLKDQSAHAHNGYTWFMTAYDFDTKKLFGIPMKTKTAEDTAKALKKVLEQARRKYAIIVSDNGKEFKNSLVDDVVADYGAKRSYTASYTPAANGGAERSVRTLSRLLGMARRAFRNGDDWVGALPVALRNYNSSANAQLGGRTPDQAEDAFVNGNVDEKTEIRTAMNRKAGWDKTNKPDPFENQPLKVGDFVRIRLGNGGGVAKNADWNFTRDAYRIRYKEKYSVGGGQTRERFTVINRAGEEVYPGDEEYWQRDQLLKFHPSMNKEKGADLKIIHRIIRPVLIKQKEKGKVVNKRGYVVSWLNGDKPSYQTFEDLELDVPHLLTSFNDKFRVKFTPVGRPGSKNFRWDLAFTEPAKTKPVARTARTLAKKRAEEEAEEEAGPAEP